jgi:hypothetical protein
MPPHRKTGTPENHIVPASLADELNGGSETVENNIVLMFPELPQTEKAMGGGRARQSWRRDAACRRHRGKVFPILLRADGAPELSSKMAAEQDMACRLERRRADGAAALIIREDPFPKEVTPALVTVSDGKPAEELDL